jgi:HK97 gp10 family phage protein
MRKTSLVGFAEFEYLLKQMDEEFGASNVRKNVLVTATKNSMKVVLQAAKDNLYPNHGLDTGQLQRTLKVTARPTRPKDLRSKYVKQGDVVIATVSAILKGGDISDGRAMFVEYGTKNKNMSVDVRGLSKKSASAVQREFCTVRMAARPFLRPALEDKQDDVIKILKSEIERLLQKYRSTYMG